MPISTLVQGVYIDAHLYSSTRSIYMLMPISTLVQGVYIDAHLYSSTRIIY